jgi:hypothetical protein
MSEKEVPRSGIAEAINGSCKNDQWPPFLQMAGETPLHRQCATSGRPDVSATMGIAQAEIGDEAFVSMVPAHSAVLGDGCAGGDSG